MCFRVLRSRVCVFKVCVFETPSVLLIKMATYWVCDIIIISIIISPSSAASSSSSSLSSPLCLLPLESLESGCWGISLKTSSASMSATLMKSLPELLDCPVWKENTELWSVSCNRPVHYCFFPRDLAMSHFINLNLTMVFQYLESTLHTLVVAKSDKPQTSFQVVRNNLC